MSLLAINSYRTLPEFLVSSKGFLLGISAHKRFISGCSADLEVELWKYVDEREDAAVGWRHPNLLLPFLLSEGFEFSSDSQIGKLSAAYLACDHFTHLLDDIADEVSDVKPLLAHASHIMLSEGRMLYLDAVGSQFLEVFERHLADALTGERFLWQRVNNRSPYGEIELLMLRKRGAMLNICLAAFCEVGGRSDLLKILEVAMGDVIVGVQLLDDVMDVEKDFNNRIFTMPLAPYCIARHNVECSWSDMSRALLEDGGWIETIYLGMKFLEQSIDQLETYGFHHLVMALRTIVNDAQELAKLIETVKATDGDPVKKVSSILNDRLVRNLGH